MKFVPSSAADQYGAALTGADNYGVSALGPASGMMAAGAAGGEGSTWKQHALSVVVGVSTGVLVAVFEAILVPWAKKKFGVVEEKSAANPGKRY